MALWLNRAGSHGEFEQKFLTENRNYLTWDGLSADLSESSDRESIRSILEEYYPDAKPGRITNFTGQIWAFVNGMKPGDWVVLPSKQKPAIHFGQIKSGY